MSILSNRSYKSGYSVERYIRSIGRYYISAAVVMTFLIATTYLTVTVALERHTLQQDISFVSSSQFIRFQQLANQTRALMRASADRALPNYIIEPMLDDVRDGIADIRTMTSQLAQLRGKISRNLLERTIPHDEAAEELYLDLNRRLEDFLVRAEKVVAASNDERRQRHTFWGAIDFAISADGLLMRRFAELIQHVHDRSTASIDNAKLISSILLVLLAVAFISASLFLFSPLLIKLRNEHRRTMEFEDRLTHLAHTDALTELRNRSSFNLELQELFGRFERSGAGFSMLTVDLDHFKAINDSFGHPAGDAVLRHVAKALRTVFRGSDIVARLGGDEFAILLPGISEEAILLSMAERAVAAIASDFLFEGRTLRISASIGGAVVPHHASDEAGLVRVTDLSLYVAKNTRNKAVIFDEASHALRLEQDLLAAALATAADNDEFVVHYQPKVSLLTGAHMGFEALVRWKHPELGLLPPGRFLPLMENSLLIRDMTRAVVKTVGRDLRVWKNAGLSPGTVAINLPEVLLVGEEGHEIFTAAIRENDLDWTDFAIEVTEDVFLNRNPRQMRATVMWFRQRGISISLDDFGTGFASLLHLRDFPFDELKIDRSFVSDIGKGDRSEQILLAMVDLSRNLGKRCVAEGIETDEQREFLLNAGCEIGQGYLFAKPVSADTVIQYLSNSIRRAPTVRSEAETAPAEGML